MSRYRFPFLVRRLNQSYLLSDRALAAHPYRRSALDFLGHPGNALSFLQHSDTNAYDWGKLLLQRYGRASWSAAEAPQRIAQALADGDIWVYPLNSNTRHQNTHRRLARHQGDSHLYLLQTGHPLEGHAPHKAQTFNSLESAAEFIGQLQAVNNPDTFWRDLLVPLQAAHSKDAPETLLERAAHALFEGRIRACRHSPTVAKTGAGASSASAGGGAKSTNSTDSSNTSSAPAPSSPATTQSNTISASTNKGGKTGAGKTAVKTEKETRVGCPIGMVTGEEMIRSEDFSLPGPFSFSWARHYRSGSSASQRGLGHGWGCQAFERLRIGTQEITLEDAEGRSIPFPKPAPGEQTRNNAEGLTLRHDGRGYYTLREGHAPLRVFNIPRNASLCPLTQLRDRHGNHLDFHHDSDRLTRITTSWGRQVSVTHDEAGRISALIAHDQNGNALLPALVRYSYDDQANLSAITDANGHSERFTYTNHIITQRTLKSGFSYHFEWDRFEPSARCLRNWGDEGYYDFRFGWDLENNTSSATDALGHSTYYRYNKQGLIVEETDPDGNSTHFAYDEAGQLLTRTNALGHSEEFRYDQHGRLGVHIDAQKNISALDYNELNLPEAVTDALGQRWTRRYNPHGALIEQSDPLGHKTRYEYNAQGLPTALIDATGQRSQYTWNTRAELIQERDPLGNTTGYTYDDHGRITRITHPDKRHTDYRYDALGQVTALTHPDGQTDAFEYDQKGNLLRYTDTAGRITEYRYLCCALDKLVQRTDADGHRFHYRYDKTGKLIALTNEKGETHTLEYDSCARLIKETGFDGRIQHYSYDAAGQLIHRLDANQRFTEYQRDPLGRLTRSYASDGQFSDYSYDALGRLTQAQNNQREVRLAYDPLGRLREEQQIDFDHKRALDPASTYTLQHRYDKLGRRTHTQLGEDHSLRYHYNALGGFTQVTRNGKAIANIERDALGREIQRQQGHTQTTTDYDPQGRLARQHAINQAERKTLIQRDYAYDALGRIQHIKDLTRGDTQFHYDALDRLKRVSGPHPETFAFDPAGNLLEGQAQANQTRGNRLQMQGDRHFDYDANGNLISEKRGKGGQLETRFEYNPDNQLIGVEKQGQRHEYAYDALGRRCQKRDSFGTTVFHWNGDVLAHEQRQHIQKTYVFEPASFRPLALIQDEKLYHYHLDHLGTPQEISDEKGTLVWQATYKSYGKVANYDIQEIDNPIRFQGQYFDEETGLHYNRFRYYDPEVGRFIHQDPIGLLGGDNNYEYVTNPVEWVDPFGLADHCEVGGSSSPIITAAEVTGKTRSEIRQLAQDKGLVPFGQQDENGLPRKWKDPVTGKQRLRLDRGHIDKTTGQPYDDPKAAVDHVHAYEANGLSKVRSPIDNNPHFPTTG